MAKQSYAYKLLSSCLAAFIQMQGSKLCHFSMRPVHFRCPTLYCSVRRLSWTNCRNIMPNKRHGTTLKQPLFFSLQDPVLYSCVTHQGQIQQGNIKIDHGAVKGKENQQRIIKSGNRCCQQHIITWLAIHNSLDISSCRLSIHISF